MFIKVWCPECGWTGIAEVGRSSFEKGHGMTIKDYVCPPCGNPISKDHYRGHRDLTEESAIPKDEY